MGVAVKCKKTDHCVDMSYGGFLQLRSKVAMLAGEPFASHYKKLLNHRRSLTGTDPFYEEFDQQTELLLQKRQISVKIADFCLQSDCGGAIHFGACKKLLRIIGNYTNTDNYGYAYRPVAFADFTALLKECVELKCDLVWY